MKPEKIDPALLAALDDFDNDGKAALTTHSNMLGLNAAVGSQQPATASVFLHCGEWQDLSRLTQLGVQMATPQSKIFTASVPLSSLSALSEDAAVEYVVGARYLRLLMDVAKPRVQVPAFRNRTNLSGQGVIVGVVDSGIDALHPAFAGRILRVWDQTANGPGVPEGNFGQELFGNAMSISHDTVGHGTHVAGIAAGAHPVFEGVAPRADLVIVKSTLQDAHIADGVSYIFRVAQDMNRPAVVNLSLGGHFDSHDGADSVCQVLDSLTGPGRIICCAAGNEGNDNIHGQANLSPGNSRRMRFIVPGGLSAAQLNGWYSGASRVEVAVRTPGNFVTPFQAVNPASPVQNYALADARVRINTPGPDFTNNDHNFRVVLRGPAPGTPVRPGLWQLLLRHAGGPATVADVWTLDGLPSPQMVFTGTSVKDSMKVGSPGAARSAVTVAAFTTKIAWQDINGVGCQVGLALNDIADFSSEGPLRNGVQKPDVAAPGAMIASALSRHSAPNAASVVNPDFLVEAGTSMATPFVTGLAALLLERNRNLDPAGVKALLNANSRVPNSAPGAFNPKWGRGLIDANNL